VRRTAGELARSEFSESNGMAKTLRLRNFHLHVRVNFC